MRARTAIGCGLLLTISSFGGWAQAQEPEASPPTPTSPAIPAEAASEATTPLPAAAAAGEVTEPTILTEASDPQDGPHPGARDEVIPAKAGGFGFSREEGFRFKSEDGANVLRLALQMGVKVEPTWHDGHNLFNGTFAFLRPILRGSFLKPWFGYRLSAELSQENPYVLDAYVDVARWDEFAFRFGQQGTPVSRHESFGPQQIFFPEYASVATYFWPGRDRGLTVYGTTGHERLDYYAGVYSGSPLADPVNIKSNYVVEGRVTVNPFGSVNPNEMPFTPDGKPLPARLSFTAQAYHGDLQTTPENFNPANSELTPAQSLLTQRMTAAGGDLWCQAGPAILFGEFYWRRSQPNGGTAYTTFGAWGQAIVDVYKNILGAGVRVNWIDPNDSLSDDRALSFEGQLAWFIHAPELVLKLRYAWIDQKSPDAATLGSFQLPFLPGTSNIGTLQLTFAF